MSDNGTVAERLAAFSHSLGDADLSDDVMHAAKRCIIDWYAATLPGSVEGPAVSLVAGLIDELGQGSAATLTGLIAPARTAALINGTASHTVEFDDIFAPAIYHPGSPTIAAALAVAQTEGGTGMDLIRATVAGYEVSTRIGKAMGRAHYRYWHNTGTIGTFGAIAAAALLRNLTIEQTAHAFAIGATMAAGLQQAFRGDSQTKPLHAGHAADAGIVAVAKARGDIRGALDMFEAPDGFGNAMSGSVSWDEVLDDMGEVWNITAMTIKNHGCCGHIFPALDGVLALQTEHGFKANDVEAIEIGGYSATVDVTGNYIVDSAPAAKFCLPFVVASGIVHGSIRLDAFSDARLNDPTVLGLMKRVTFHLDPDVDALFPGQRSANVLVRLNDGKERRRNQPHRVGDPALPLSDVQLSDKFRELGGTVLPVEALDQLLDNLWRLEQHTDLGFTYRVRAVPGLVSGS